jgi:hypothetical protein
VTKKPEGKKVSGGKEELMDIARDNVMFGIDSARSTGEKVGKFVGGVFDNAETTSKDLYEIMGSVLMQARKTYNETFDVVRKQANKTLKS